MRNTSPVALGILVGFACNLIGNLIFDFILVLFLGHPFNSGMYEVYNNLLPWSFYACLISLFPSLVGGAYLAWSFKHQSFYNKSIVLLRGLAVGGFCGIISSTIMVGISNHFSYDIWLFAASLLVVLIAAIVGCFAALWLSVVTRVHQ